MDLTKSKEYRTAYIGFFMMLYLANSFVVTNNVISSAMTIGLWCITAFIIMHRNLKIDKKLLTILIVLSLCMLLTAIYNRETFWSLTATLFSYVIVLMYVSSITFDTFKEAFILVMYWLSIISLVGFVLYLLFPALHNINVVMNTYSNLFIYVDTTHYTRNTGMFWEPGAYQTFLNIALLLEILKKEFSAKKVIVFIITIITTYSTTGYLILLVILMIFVLKKDKKRNKKGQIAIIAFLLLLILAVYFNQDFLFGATLTNGQQTVFGKILNFTVNNKSMSSASVRYNAVIKPISQFFYSPIFGRGYYGLKEELYEYTHGMNTCTFINFFAVYGMLFGIIMITGIIKFAYKLNKRWMIIFLILIVLFMATMSEDYVNNPIMLMPVLYGYSNCKNSNMEMGYDDC